MTLGSSYTQPIHPIMVRGVLMSPHRIHSTCMVRKLGLRSCLRCSRMLLRAGLSANVRFIQAPSWTASTIKSAGFVFGADCR